MTRRAKTRHKKPQNRDAARPGTPDTAHGSRVPSEANGNKQARIPQASPGRIRTWLSKPTGRIIAAVAIVVAAALTAIGTNIGDDAYKGVAKAVRGHRDPVKHRSSRTQHTNAPLGVDTMI